MVRSRSDLTKNKLEEKVWSKTLSLRGNLDELEFKHMSLGLLFLLFISYQYQEEQELAAGNGSLASQGKGLLKDKERKVQMDETVVSISSVKACASGKSDRNWQDEADGMRKVFDMPVTREDVGEDGFLFRKMIYEMPPSARWETIAGNCRHPKIGLMIDIAMHNVDRANPELSGILPFGYSRPEIDNVKMSALVTMIVELVRKAGYRGYRQLFQRIFEHTLAKLTVLEGKMAGEFYVPDSIVETLMSVLEPFSGNIYDPSCGSGRLLVHAAESARKNGVEAGENKLFGQYTNSSAWKLAYMNMIIHGLDPDDLVFNPDVSLHDCHPQLKADVIVSNPPFNLPDWGAERLVSDKRWKFGLPPSSNANFAWLQHAISHLGPNGKAGIILANGSLSSKINGEDVIRKQIVEADLLDCIIAMPSHLFDNTLIPVAVWVLKAHKTHKRKTLFIDARDMGTMVTKKIRVLSNGSENENDNEIKKIAESYHAFVAGKQIIHKDFCAVVKTEEIAAKGYVLNPGIYVESEAEVKLDEPFDEKMSRLSIELTDLFSKSSELEEEIKEKLTFLGYMNGDSNG